MSLVQAVVAQACQGPIQVERTGVDYFPMKFVICV